MCMGHTSGGSAASISGKVLCTRTHACRFGNKPDPAVVLLFKKPFNKDALSSLASGGTTLTADFCNDIYSKVGLMYLVGGDQPA